MLAQDHVEGVKEGKGLSAKERGIMRIGISPKTNDYCYNCAKLKAQNFSVYQNKSILFVPEKHYRTKINHSTNSAHSFSRI